MPPPYTHATYDDMVKDVLPGYVAAMNDSMLGAASNVKLQATVQESTEQDSEIPESNQDENDQILVHERSDNVFDCDVSLDGNWQRRGYTSLNGLISAIERVSDKVVDIAIMTKDCRPCKYWDGKEEEPEYEKWILSYKCMISHEGSSGSMETEGAVSTDRSKKKNEFRYTNYIGDGNSSAFKKVSESNPYPNKPIEKLECVGHIQKRVHAGLLSLVKEHKGIGGKGEGKLTRKVINTLQNYYGMAIRNTKNTNIPQMKTAIVAVLHHCTQKEECDKDDRHKYCPSDHDTWCKYQKSKIESTEFKGDRINILEHICNLIRPL